MGSYLINKIIDRCERSAADWRQAGSSRSPGSGGESAAASCAEPTVNGVPGSNSEAGEESAAMPSTGRVPGSGLASGSEPGSGSAEESSDRPCEPAKSGSRSIRIQQQDYDSCGRTELLAEARELEKRGLIRVRWFGGGTDIERISFRLDRLPLFYEMAGRKPKAVLLAEEEGLLSYWAARASTPWLKAYYQDQISGVGKGRSSQDLKKYGTKLFQCLNALEQLEQRKKPEYYRSFSSRHLGGSKVFERELMDRVISIARTYHPMADDAMDDDEVLSQLYLESYTQEMALKGELLLWIDDHRHPVNLADFPYGVVLNSESIRRARISPRQRLRRVITVENKANFMAMPFEEGTLFIFSHGFFSPLERRFLRQLERVLSAASPPSVPEEESSSPSVPGEEDASFSVPEEEGGTPAAPVEYYHTGDLDYGGIRIFRHIRTEIFPNLQPYRMDAAWYDAHLQYAVDMEPSAWEKLSRLEEPALAPLIGRILEERKVIEQEVWLE